MKTTEQNISNEQYSAMTSNLRSFKSRKLRYLFIGIIICSIFSVARSFGTEGISWTSRKSSVESNHFYSKLWPHDMQNDNGMGDAINSSNEKNNTNTRRTDGLKVSKEADPLDKVRLFRQLHRDQKKI